MKMIRCQSFSQTVFILSMIDAGLFAIEEFLNFLTLSKTVSKISTRFSLHLLVHLLSQDTV